MFKPHVYHCYPFQIEGSRAFQTTSFQPQAHYELKSNKDNTIKYHTTFRGKLLVGRDIIFKKSLIYTNEKDLTKAKPIEQIVFWSYPETEAHHPILDKILSVSHYAAFIQKESSLYERVKKTEVGEDGDYINIIRDLLNPSEN
uniref:ASCH domain-containing protein n=1 Tax=Rhabditophanes sp. KR3021 TaxID=114890 RepID=A0AC35U169_9BILA